nr:hypothetical protein [Tanacetum cinerariifolium]
SRPDLQFAICMCARYQARPTEKHDSSVALIAFADADHAGCQDTRRSTSGSFQFLGERLKKDQEKDKIGSKRDKNGKRGEAGKNQKQLQLIEREKTKKE